MDFNESETKKNLMKAYVGESQARNRYSIAEEKCNELKQYMLERLFHFTADQEKEHAQIFYSYLEGQPMTLETEGTYPIDSTNDLVSLFKSAAHNEYQEYEEVYAEFSRVATKEGFNQIAFDFKHIAEIEKEHGDRFKHYLELIENGTLYTRTKNVVWMCLNCGFIYEGQQVPEKCPVCNHDQGYFVEKAYAPFTNE